MTDIDTDSGSPEPGDAERDESSASADGSDSTAGFMRGDLPDGVRESALETVRQVLHSQTAVEDLKNYYDIGGDYAGRTFLDAPPVVVDEFTPAGLFAVSLLQVSVGPRAARRFLDPGAERDELTTALAAIPSDVELTEAEESTFSASVALMSK